MAVARYLKGRSGTQEVVRNHGETTHLSHGEISLRSVGYFTTATNHLKRKNKEQRKSRPFQSTPGSVSSPLCLNTVRPRRV